MARTLIRSATIVTMDPALGDFAQGDILVGGATIAAVTPRPTSSRQSNSPKGAPGSAGGCNRETSPC
ncbi:MAG: hypothetical protein ACRCVA_15965 [Phreatobacter sp.]